jgi:putative ABC transport system permease protein
VSAPPRLAERWLERRLHPDERQELIGDLAEQFQHRVATAGSRAARRWYWRQALSLAVGFGLYRRDLISTNHERTRGRWLLWNAAADWRYAWRALVSSHGTTIVALLTLTLSLGLSTAVFSLTNSLLLKPLPYPDADRLVRLAEARPAFGPTAGAPRLPDTGGDVSDMAIGQFMTMKSIEAVTPYDVSARTVTTSKGTEQRKSAEVGGSFFDLLGTIPVQGRLFVKEDSDPNAAPSAVVSESFWREVLDGRSDVVGQPLMIDEKPYQLIGVAKGDVRFPESGVDVWLAGQWRWPQLGPRRNFQMWSTVIGRLAQAETLERATAEVKQVGGRIASADPAFLDGANVPVPVFRVRGLQDDVVQPLRPALLALTVGMALVLAAACANLVNLLLARSTARHREMAVRLTLGANRWRVVRPLLFEQLLLAAGGALGGGLLAWWLLHAMPAFAPPALARLVDVDFDFWSLAFASTVALAIGIVVGLLPAWQLPSANLRDLSAAGRVVVVRRVMSAEAFRRVLVAGQVALAVMLLVGATLLGRTLWSLTRVDPGYRGAHALTFQIGLPDLIFRQPERQFGYFDQLLTRLSQNPQVVAVGASSTLPLNQVGSSGSFGIEGRPRPVPPEPWPRANKIAITPGYLAAVGTRVIRGRGITAGDSVSAEPVILIDQTTAETYFKGQEPIGQRIDFIRKLWRIVGIVEPIKQNDVTKPSDAALYFPAVQLPAVFAFNRLTGGVAVRSTGDAMNLVPFIRSTMAEIDAGSPLHAVERLDDRLSQTFAEPRFYSLALGLFATLALVTSVLGIYGVLSYSVERRQLEFGVRRALGGDERHILTLVLRQAASVVALGIVAGIGVSASGAGLLRSLLFGVKALDATTFVAAGVLVLAIGLAAAAIPAWRAMHVDPALALRAD